jgi:tetratricopeptide (TPR) repeat protein
MAYLIPLAIIILSLGGAFYIVVKKMRTLSEAGKDSLVYPDFGGQAEPAADQSQADSKDEVKVGSNFFIFMEKFFRKVRVKVMKIENWLAGMSSRLHERGLKGKISAAKNEDVNGELPKSPQENKDNMGSFVALNDSGGQFDEKYWLDIIKTEPRSAYPYKKLGEIYLAREDFREARSSFKYALKLDPADKEAVAKLSGLRGKRTRKK